MSGPAKTGGRGHDGQRALARQRGGPLPSHRSGPGSWCHPFSAAAGPDIRNRSDRSAGGHPGGPAPELACLFRVRCRQFLRRRRAGTGAAPPFRNAGPNRAGPAGRHDRLGNRAGRGLWPSPRHPDPLAHGARTGRAAGRPAVSGHEPGVSRDPWDGLRPCDFRWTRPRRADPGPCRRGGGHRAYPSLCHPPPIA